MLNMILNTYVLGNLQYLLLIFQIFIAVTMALSLKKRDRYSGKRDQKGER